MKRKILNSAVLAGFLAVCGAANAIDNFPDDVFGRGLSTSGVLNDNGEPGTYPFDWSDFNTLRVFENVGSLYNDSIVEVDDCRTGGNDCLVVDYISFGIYGNFASATVDVLGEVDEVFLQVELDCSQDLDLEVTGRGTTGTDAQDFSCAGSSTWKLQSFTLDGVGDFESIDFDFTSSVVQNGTSVYIQNVVEANNNGNTQQGTIFTDYAAGTDADDLKVEHTLPFDINKASGTTFTAHPGYARLKSRTDKATSATFEVPDSYYTTTGSWSMLWETVGTTCFLLPASEEPVITIYDDTGTSTFTDSLCDVGGVVTNSNTDDIEPGGYMKIEWPATTAVYQVKINTLSATDYQ